MKNFEEFTLSEILPGKPAQKNTVFFLTTTMDDAF